ncbi:MAG: Uncharacterised protein [Hyphomonas sp. TMED17]|nr:MAG: Uncharacterised protein [Hyphomonas sp. TMED17]
MFHFVLFQQECDPFGQAFHSFILLRHHLFQIERQVTDFDAHTGKIILRGSIGFGSVQERFGWYAANI